METLPLELQCQIVSQITNLDDVIPLFRTNQLFRELAGQCIVNLRSNQERIIQAKDLVHFRRLNTVHQIIIRITGIDDIINLNHLKLQSAVFLISSFTPDILISMYLTQHCDDNPRKLVFMIYNPSIKFGYDILAFDINRIWINSVKFPLPLSIQKLTQCTGINNIQVPYYHAWRGFEEYPAIAIEWLETLNINIVPYYPTNINYYNKDLRNFFRDANLGPSDPKNSNSKPLNQVIIFPDTGISSMDLLLKLFKLYALVNNLLISRNTILVTPLMQKWFNRLSLLRIMNRQVNLSQLQRLIVISLGSKPLSVIIELNDPVIFDTLEQQNQLISKIMEHYM